jgi:hypothetical protein
VDCEHDWKLREVRLSAAGADQVQECTRGCGAVSYAPGQAAVLDSRPGLGAGAAT